MSLPHFTADESLFSTNRYFRSLGAVFAADNGGGVTPALVGRWPIGNCEVTCIEVCTRFCAPTGFECCESETRCNLHCPGFDIRIW
jgi:hypothetical protein